MNVRNVFRPIQGLFFVVGIITPLLPAQDSAIPGPKPNSSRVTGSPAGRAATPLRTTAQAKASLLIVPDVDCKVLVDDRDLGLLLKGHPRTIRVSIGDHLVQAQASSGQGEWQDTVSVDKPVQVVVKTEIARVVQDHEAAASKAAEEAEQERQEAAAKEAAAAEAQRKESAALSALEGRWSYIHGTTSVQLELRLDGQELNGSMTKIRHTDAVFHPGECHTIEVPSTLGAIANGLSGCLSCSVPTSAKTTCDQGTTTPSSERTQLFTVEGWATEDGIVHIKAQYQRCSGDCTTVSNPRSLDLGGSTVDLRDSNELYWRGQQFRRQ